VLGTNTITSPADGLYVIKVAWAAFQKREVLFPERWATAAVRDVAFPGVECSRNVFGVEQQACATREVRSAKLINVNLPRAAKFYSLRCRDFVAFWKEFRNDNYIIILR